MAPRALATPFLEHALQIDISSQQCALFVVSEALCNFASQRRELAVTTTSDAFIRYLSFGSLKEFKAMLLDSNKSATLIISTTRTSACKLAHNC